jgi:glutamate decarboxylase
MGAAFALFRDEKSLSLVAHYAEYIIRKGSRDLGRTSLEGSRSGMAMLVHSGLRIMGRKGYGLLIDTGIEKAREFARLIDDANDFELMTEPELNILTYRLVPSELSQKLHDASSDPVALKKINDSINKLTVHVQKVQRDRGHSFVSRTSLRIRKYNNQKLNVFRVVLANPLTEVDHLKEILEEQRAIAVDFCDL